MRILFVADGRSPIAHNWIKYFVESGVEVHLVSTFPCAPALEFVSFNVVPVAFSSLVKESLEYGLKEPPGRGGFDRRTLLRSILPVRTRTLLRQWLGPWTLPRSARLLKDIIQQINPDLIHAMRIPFEGMLAATALKEFPHIPLMISVWGNDFTLHAPASKMMTKHTRLVMRRANALHTDTFRDQLFARQWGYDERNPVIVLPCAGGVDMEVFYPSPRDVSGAVTIINPRGFRAYVRNDTFFRSIPIVVQEITNIQFLCPAMEGEAQAVNWLESLDIAQYVSLLPRQTPEQMAGLFRQSQISMSITTHDGTPNSLLEAMACGCFPIVGNIDSLREWITQGVNGILVDPGDPLELAQAVIKAVRDTGMRDAARSTNIMMVQERAEYRQRMGEVYEFYKKIVQEREVPAGV